MGTPENRLLRFQGNTLGPNTFTRGLNGNPAESPPTSNFLRRELEGGERERRGDLWAYLPLECDR